MVAGVGATAPIAVEAAAADPRVSALLLLSPAPAWIERGTMRERIRRLRRPIYFSNAPEDFREFYVTDAFYQAGDRPRSRVAEVKAEGSGARPFRRDSAAVSMRPVSSASPSSASDAIRVRSASRICARGFNFACA